MNKAELVEAIAKKTGGTKAAVEGTLDALMDTVTLALGKGDSVALIGFGTFSVSKRAARKGRNPATGAEIKIPASKVAKFSAGAKLKKAVVDDQRVVKLLGPAKFRDLSANKKNEVGATTGLAWTEVGGQILTTEATVMDGRGKLTTTGKLGDVMQESAKAARSYIWSHADELGIDHGQFRRAGVHIHVPAGAIPKDGPSAGITLATTLVSALAKLPVRKDVAMTGEITLRGKVLPIGGVKEKLLAAHRIGVTTAILPRENEKDLADVPKNVLEGIEVHLVEHVDQVLKLALVPPDVPPQQVTVEGGTTTLGGLSDGMTH